MKYLYFLIPLLFLAKLTFADCVGPEFVKAKIVFRGGNIQNGHVVVFEEYLYPPMEKLTSGIESVKQLKSLLYYNAINSTGIITYTDNIQTARINEKIEFNYALVKQIEMKDVIMVQLNDFSGKKKYTSNVAYLSSKMELELLKKTPVFSLKFEEELATVVALGYNHTYREADFKSDYKKNDLKKLKRLRKEGKLLLFKFTSPCGC